MKVLFIIDTLEIGGAEKSILEMLPFFKKVEWVICHIYRGDYLKSNYEAKGVRVISLNLGGKYQFAKAIHRVSEVIRVEHPDIVHSTLLRSSLVCRFLRRRSSFVHIGSFVNDSYVQNRYNRLSIPARGKLLFFELLDRLTSGWCDHYISITETIRLTNAQYLKIPLEKISVIYRGRDTERFSVASGKLSTDSFVFLNVARLIDRKGQLELIRAFDIIAKKHKNVELQLAGEGPSYDKYRAEIRRLGLQDKVRLLGKRDDIPSLLQACRCFVMPSHFEGLGGAIIEAMLSGKPVIASDIPVLRENVKENYNGLIFSLGNVKDLAEKMDWIVTNPEHAQKLGLRGREFAVERFDIAKVASQYENIYQRFA